MLILWPFVDYPIGVIVTGVEDPAFDLTGELVFIAHTRIIVWSNGDGSASPVYTTN